jgi:hypothetical protein
MLSFTRGTLFRILSLERVSIPSKMALMHRLDKTSDPLKMACSFPLYELEKVVRLSFGEFLIEAPFIMRILERSIESPVVILSETTSEIECSALHPHALSFGLELIILRKVENEERHQLVLRLHMQLDGDILIHSQSEEPVHSEFTAECAKFGMITREAIRSEMTRVSEELFSSIIDGLALKVATHNIPGGKRIKRISPGSSVVGIWIEC